MTEKDDQARVYVSTYPTMMNLINEVTETGGAGSVPATSISSSSTRPTGRSIQKYKAIFEYFDASWSASPRHPRMRSTATPTALFDLEDGVPTDFYSLDEAVDDGFLVPPARCRCSR